MARSFAIDVEKCPKCEGRMKLVALVEDSHSVDWRKSARLVALRGLLREWPKHGLAVLTVDISTIQKHRRHRNPGPLALRQSVASSGLFPVVSLSTYRVRRRNV